LTYISLHDGSSLHYSDMNGSDYLSQFFLICENTVPDSFLDSRLVSQSGFFVAALNYILKKRYYLYAVCQVQQGPSLRKALETE